MRRSFFEWDPTSSTTPLDDEEQNMTSLDDEEQELTRILIFVIQRSRRRRGIHSMKIICHFTKNQNEPNLLEKYD
jgi:hypothetical protein